MTSSPFERARLRQRLAQVFALATVAGAGWIIISSMPGAEATSAGVMPVATKPIEVTALRGVGSGPISHSDFDPEFAALTFNQIYGAPKPRPVEQPAPAPEEIASVEIEPEVVSDPEAPVFVASIKGAGVESAILRVGDTQIWVRKGETRAGVELLEVGPDFASVRHNGRAIRAERGERKGPSVSTLVSGSAPPPQPEARGSQNANLRVEVQNLTPEEADRQRRIEEMRRAAIERRDRGNGAQQNAPANGNRGGPGARQGTRN